MTRASEHSFRPAWWVPGAHAQTLWGKFARRPAPVSWRVRRLRAADGEWLELRGVDAAAGAPRLLMLHGLEGSVRSHYVSGLIAGAQARGWGADLLHFRGCGGSPNETPRFYHSGETTDLQLVVRHLLADSPGAPIVIVGVSLGGNVLLKWLGELGPAYPPELRAGVAISVPYDLERGCRHLQRGFSRMYDRHFLRTLREKALRKLERHPQLFDGAALRRARTIYDFDDVVTAPVHGFRDAHDYYSRSSSLAFLGGIRVPTLLLSAVDDPFLPPAVLDEVRAVAAGNDALRVEFHEHGGHVGFVGGRLPWRPEYFAERRTLEFLFAHVGAERRQARRSGT